MRESKAFSSLEEETACSAMFQKLLQDRTAPRAFMRGNERVRQLLGKQEPLDFLVERSMVVAGDEVIAGNEC